MSARSFGGTETATRGLSIIGAAVDRQAVYRGATSPASDVVMSQFGATLNPINPSPKPLNPINPSPKPLNPKP